MCELLALSASAPVDIKLSLSVLARHGGETGIHADGWGVAYFEGPDVQVFREPGPAAGSPLVDCLQRHPRHSSTVVAHVRHATRGAIRLANTQPFARELAGRMHVFAHYGTLAGLTEHKRRPRRFQSIGETDSELAFCELLERFARKHDDMSALAASDGLRIFTAFAAEMRRLGPANIILAMNETIFIHSDRRTQRPGVIEPPGLWFLQRRCSLEGQSELSAAGVTLAPAAALNVALVASVPLTSEPWRPLPQGTVLVLTRGSVQDAHMIDNGTAG